MASSSTDSKSFDTYLFSLFYWTATLDVQCYFLLEKSLPLQHINTWNQNEICAPHN